MAVVTKYLDYVPDGTLPQNPIDGHMAGGRVRVVGGTVEIANGDSIASTIALGAVPSHWRPLKSYATLHHDAITGVTDFDVGDSNDPDGLADGLDLSSAGTKNPFAAMDASEVGAPLWEILGYASAEAAPATIDLIGTLKAATTAAGTISFEMMFATI